MKRKILLGMIMGTLALTACTSGIPSIGSKDDLSQGNASGTVSSSDAASEDAENGSGITAAGPDASGADYSSIDFDAIYDPIIREHLKVIQKGYDSGETYEYLLDGVKEEVINTTNPYPDMEIGCTIKDITDDGIPELLIGKNVGVETGNPLAHLYGAFSLDSNMEPYVLVENTDIDPVRFTFFRRYESYVGDKSGDTRIARTKKILKEKYGEEFDVFDIKSDGPSWDATVSPVNNPEVLFALKFEADRISGSSTYNPSGYARGYLCYLVEKKLQEDLDDIIPGAYVRVTEITRIDWNDDTLDFRNMSLEEMMDNITKYDYEGVGPVIYADIYIDQSVTPAADYEAEYKYFTETVDQYIEENKMFPLIIGFTKLKTSAYYNTIDHLSRSRHWDNGYEKAMGVGTAPDYYQSGVYGPNSSDVGNPPNIAANFLKESEGYIGSYTEYERRRKLLDQATQN